MIKAWADVIEEMTGRQVFEMALLVGVIIVSISGGMFQVGYNNGERDAIDGLSESIALNSTDVAYFQGSDGTRFFGVDIDERNQSVVCRFDTLNYQKTGNFSFVYDNNECFWKDGSAISNWDNPEFDNRRVSANQSGS